MSGECTCSALRMAARRVTQIYDAALAGQGINTSQYAVLSRLAPLYGEAPTMQRLAERLGLDRTTLAHNLRPLERDGLVAIETDPADRRVRRVRPTVAGRAKRETCLPLWRRAQDHIDDRFGTESTALLMAALGAIARIDPLPRKAAHHTGNRHAG